MIASGIADRLDHKNLEKNHKIPSNHIQCTVSRSALRMVCVFPWLFFDSQFCAEYVDMCCNYYEHEMEKWLDEKPVDEWQLTLIRNV